MAAYTFAKNLGNADGNVGGFIQNAYRPDLEHGPVSPDLRHRFTISYLYELPVGHAKRWLGNANGVMQAFLGGWQLAGITTVQSGEAITALVRVIQDKNTPQCERAVGTLSQCGTAAKTVLPTVLALLDDESAARRLAAEIAWDVEWALQLVRQADRWQAAFA